MASKDTIPRIDNLNYFKGGFCLLNRDLTFDQIRKGLVELAKSEARKDIQVSRRGYTLIHRLKSIDDFSLWTTTRDLISEFMRLGFVIKTPVPRRKHSVDKFRDVTYYLTKKGKKLADFASREDDTDFRDQFFKSMWTAHPYLRELLVKLDDGDIIIPRYSLGTRNLNKNRRLGEDELLKDSQRWLSEKLDYLGVDEKDITAYEQELIEYVISKTEKKPYKNKTTIIKHINDKAKQIFLKANGISFDVVTFDQLMKLSRRFWVTNYYFNMPRTNALIIYSTAKIDSPNNELKINRNKFSDNIEKILVEIKRQFYGFKSPFVPISDLRALVCYTLKINDEIFNHALRELRGGKWTVDYNITLLRDMYGGVNPSVKPFTIGGNRYYTMSLRKKEE